MHSVACKHDLEQKSPSEPKPMERHEAFVVGEASFSGLWAREELCLSSLGGSRAAPVKTETTQRGGGFLSLTLCTVLAQEAGLHGSLSPECPRRAGVASTCFAGSPRGPPTTTGFMAPGQ